MAKVEQVENRDPDFKMIGIITLEDIIEELVDKQDEDDNYTKDQNHKHKEKLVLLFSD